MVPTPTLPEKHGRDDPGYPQREGSHELEVGLGWRMYQKSLEVESVQRERFYETTKKVSHQKQGANVFSTPWTNVKTPLRVGKGEPHL